MSPSAPFWQTKTLEQMNRDEWESVCDGCAKCCLHKFVDEDSLSEDKQTEQLHFSNVACVMLNTKTCQCTHYADRAELVPNCVILTKANLNNIDFMPPSCSYRRLKEGRGLPSWHPLLHKGKKSAMHKVGMSVRGKIVSERDADMANFEDHIVIWPLQDLD